MTPSLYIRNILRGAPSSIGAARKPSTTTPGNCSREVEVQEVEEPEDQPFSTDNTSVDSSSEEETALEYKSPKKQQQQQPTPTETLLTSSSVLEAVASMGKRGAQTPTTSPTSTLPTPKKINKTINSTGSDNEVPDVFVSKRVAPLRRQRHHSLPSSGGTGGLSTLYSSVPDDKADQGEQERQEKQQQQQQQQQPPTVSSPRRKKADSSTGSSSKNSSNWLLTPKSSPRKIALFFTGGGSSTNNSDKGGGKSNKTSSSRHLNETSKPAAATQQQQHTSYISPTKQSRRPMLNRGGQVTFTGQQGYFGRRASSTQGVLERHDRDEFDNSSRSILQDFNGSTHGLFTSISSGLATPAEEDNGADQDISATAASASAAVDVDYDNKNIVSKYANVTVSEAVARKPKVLNRGGQVGGIGQQAYYGHHSASMNNIIEDYMSILQDFQDSAHVVQTSGRASAQGFFPGQPLLEENGRDTSNLGYDKAILNLGDAAAGVVIDDDNKSMSSKDVSLTLSEATTMQPKVSNRGGQVGGARSSGPTPGQQAYFGRRSESMKNILKDYCTILEDFGDSLNAQDSGSASEQGYVPGQSLVEESGRDTNKAILNRGGQVTVSVVTTGPQHEACFGRRSASAQNMLASYENILEDFQDSARAVTDSARNGGSVWQSSIISSIPGPPATAPHLKQKSRKSIGGGFNYPNTNDTSTDNKALSATQPHQRREAGSIQKTAAATTASLRQATQGCNTVGANKTNTAAMQIAAQACLNVRPALRQPPQHQWKQRRNSASGGSNTTNTSNNQALSASCYSNIYRKSTCGASENKRANNSQELSTSYHTNACRKSTARDSDLYRASNQELSVSCHANINNQAILSPTTQQRQARPRRNSIGGYDAKAMISEYQSILREFDDSARRSHCTDDSTIWSRSSLDTPSTASFALSSPIAQKPAIALSSLL